MLYKQLDSAVANCVERTYLISRNGKRHNVMTMTSLTIRLRHDATYISVISQSNFAFLLLFYILCDRPLPHGKKLSFVCRRSVRGRVTTDTNSTEES